MGQAYPGPGLIDCVLIKWNRLRVDRETALVRIMEIKL